MPTSSYMSDIKVEIAFTSLFTTPAVLRVWTDVSEWVELADGINIGYGRSDERSQADANTLSLTLDNTDGRFTPERTASPYYPNVRLYRPIRVTATPPGGVPSVRFTGYVSEWPTEWDGSDGYASSTLTASSRLARLGLSPAPRSLLEQQILGLRPALYYTFGDPEGSTTAAESSGNAGPAMTASSVVFGSAAGPPFDGLTAGQFTGGAFSIATKSAPFTSSDFTISAYFLRDPATAFVAQESVARIAVGNGRIGMDYAEIQIDASGVLFAAGSIGGPISRSSGVVVADGLLHHAALTCTSGTWRLYLDGVLRGTWAETGIAASSALMGVISYKGSASHAAFFNRALSALEINGVVAAGTGNVGESSSARLRRYASYVDIPSSEVITDGLTHTHVPVESGTQGAIDLMRQIEVTESAVLHDRRDGDLALVGESVRYDAPVAFTLDMAQQQVEADYAPRHDPSTVVNDVTVSRVGGTPTARVIDSSSRDEFGLISTGIEVTSDDDELPMQLASWQILRFSDPRTRVPNVTVNVGAQVDKTPSPDTLLAADIHTLMRVVNLPAQAPTSTAEYFVEGYTESIGVESHVISFNVSPSYPFTSVFILDDPVRGVLDGTYVLGL